MRSFGSIGDFVSPSTADELGSVVWLGCENGEGAKVKTSVRGKTDATGGHLDGCGR